MRQSELREALNYCPETGDFTWRKPSSKRQAVGDIAGSVGQRGRVQIKLRQRLYLAHRLAWLYCYGEWPKNQIDHIDGNPSNNALSNLREATNAENSLNRPVQSNSQTGIKNIFPGRRRSWRASVMKRGKSVLSKEFNCLGQAVKAVSAARNEHHGRYARGTV